MKRLNIILLTVISTFLITAQAYAGSKWVRLTWQGDASTEATISFTPNGSNNNPYVSYGYNTSESNWNTQSITFTTSMASITSKHVRLSDLSADSEVYFRICDDNGCGERFWFRTAPDDNTPFVYVAGGDTRTGWTNRQDGNKLVAKIRPLFVMHGGDYTNSNNNSEWGQWLIDWELSYSDDTINGIAYKRIYPLVATHGNHEDGDISTICKMLGVDANRDNSCSAYDTYYSVNVSPLLRVYTLNSQFMNQSSTLQNAQNSWLNNDLSSNGGSVQWRTAQYHKPMFPHYSGKSDNQTLFNWWAQDFYDYGVNLVVESDTHLTKLTEIVAPSGNGYAGADQGVTSGTVYVGEGSWGAPARSANDPKAWTVDLASIQQFKVISVNDTQMEVRTAQFDSSASMLSKADRDSDTSVLPSNVNWWLPNGVGEVLTLETDLDNRSVLAGSTGGSATNTSLSAVADTFISSTNANTNYNGSAEELLADGQDSVYGEMQSLIKWDVSSIVTCSTIESVKVELNVFNLSPYTYNLYAGSNTWNENTATWNSVGGSGHQGNLIGSFTPSSTGFYSIQLNAAGITAVENWIQGNGNHGIVVASSATDGIDFHDRESGSGPKLVIAYNQGQCGGSNQAPQANFTTSINDLVVQFSDDSTDSDGSIVSWSWNFGDGNQSSSKNPQHIYSSEGTYNVSLTVTDDKGVTDNYSKNVTVVDSSQSTMTVTFTASDDTFIASSQVNNNFDGVNDELLADNSDNTYGVMHALIKWNLSSIASCATVESVSIQLNVFDQSPGAYNIFSGVNSWNETSATWNSVSGTSHQGSQIASFTPNSTGIYNLTLNATGISHVQSWVNGAANNGIVIASGGTSNGVDIHDKESGSGPKITIAYNQGQCN